MYSLLGAATLSLVKFHLTDSVVAILLMRNPKLLFSAGKLQSRIWTFWLSSSKFQYNIGGMMLPVYSSSFIKLSLASK